MIRRHRLKICFLALMILIAWPVVQGRAAPGNDPGGPFRVEMELTPDLPSVRFRRAPLAVMPDLPAGRDDDSLLRRDLGAGGGGTAGKGRSKTHSAGEELFGTYFRLSLSRSLAEQRERDLLRFGKDDDDTLKRIRSLPSLLGNPFARDTIGAIGDIFKPQLNLEIDF